MDPAEILREIMQHQMEFAERPHTAFGNLPVCPFAKQARRRDLLGFVVRPLEVERALADIKWWDRSQYQAMILVDPRKELPIAEFESLTDQIKARLDQDLELFEAHPECKYLYNGILTRQDPYPNWQIMEAKVLDRAKELLRYSDWYQE